MKQIRLSVKVGYDRAIATVQVQILVAQGGNQCGLILDSYSPCRMEMRKEQPDFERCELKDTAVAEAVGKYKR
jgi:hypothetical protein